ncbi:MAG: methyl-accepting chemotaxis protein [Betaproteobacteria bacterium]|nr:methyl-accepting chemotaxis protein [Betaproteobacteria bacterium]
MKLKTSFKNWPIALKLNIVQSIALITLLTIAIVWLTASVTGIVVEHSITTVRQINHQALNMIQIYDETVEKNVTRTGNILKELLPPRYTLDTTENVTINGTQTPVLRAGGETLNLNFSVVDRFTAMSSAVATVFVRDGDDFVRISTSLKDGSGQRAIGTRLDRNHPARTALLANQTYIGKANLFNRDYITHYQPIQDASGNVIAALFVGRDFTSELELLRQKILEIKPGQNGYVYVVDAGNNPGTMVVHPTLAGKNLYDEKDPRGLPYIRTIIEQKSGTLTYWYTDSAIGETEPREKVAVFEFFPQWNWVVVSVLHHDDLASDALFTRNSLIVGAIALCALLSTIVFVSSRRWVSQPLKEAISAMEQIAEGHLTVAIPECASDEVGQLLTATRVMAEKIRSALSDIQNAALQLADSSEQLLNTANEVARQSAEQSGSALAMASSIEEMNANIVHISDSAQNATQTSIDSDHVSSEGAEVIQQATDSMTRIADTVRTASDTVRALGQESQAISRIVDVIREIADQTNLLALNAAIEAARAGEQGRGFAVVADEVRKLAERTSGSTQEISGLIRRILDGTTNAVTNMEAGVRQVEEGVSYAEQAGGSMTSIRQSAHQVATAVTTISHALTEQSGAITEISHNVEKITAMADQNSQVAKESAQCASGLEQLARTLRERISHFSI